MRAYEHARESIVGKVDDGQWRNTCTWSAANGGQGEWTSDGKQLEQHEGPERPESTNNSIPKNTYTRADKQDEQKWSRENPSSTRDAEEKERRKNNLSGMQGSQGPRPKSIGIEPCVQQTEPEARADERRFRAPRERGLRSKSRVRRHPDADGPSEGPWEMRDDAISTARRTLEALQDGRKRN